MLRFPFLNVWFHERVECFTAGNQAGYSSELTELMQT